jgi:hypothetical protein
MRTVPLADVRIGPQYHPTRLWTDSAALIWVEYYRGQIRNGKELEPITVDARMFIVDGHHRWYAHVLEKCETIRVIVSSTGR